MPCLIPRWIRSRANGNLIRELVSCLNWLSRLRDPDVEAFLTRVSLNRRKVPQAGKAICPDKSDSLRRLMALTVTVAD